MPPRDEYRTKLNELANNEEGIKPQAEGEWFYPFLELFNVNVARLDPESRNPPNLCLFAQKVVWQTSNPVIPACPDHLLPSDCSWI